MQYARLKKAIMAQDQQRVNATAEAFARGMLGEDMPARTKWLVTPDSIVRGRSTNLVYRSHQ